MITTAPIVRRIMIFDSEDGDQAEILVLGDAAAARPMFEAVDAAIIAAPELQRANYLGHPDAPTGAMVKVRRAVQRNPVEQVMTCALLLRRAIDAAIRRGEMPDVVLWFADTYTVGRW